VSLVTTQRVTAEKREQAKVLRRQMTAAERALWQELRANRLGGWQFRRQQIIDGFIVDFYCHALALLLPRARAGDRGRWANS
jgi:very-short-patch-repair endonuclease